MQAHQKWEHISIQACQTWEHISMQAHQKWEHISVQACQTWEHINMQASQACILAKYTIKWACKARQVNNLAHLVYKWILASLHFCTLHFCTYIVTVWIMMY